MKLFTVEYIWIDGEHKTKSLTKIIPSSNIPKLEDIKKLKIDGTKCKLTDEDSSVVILDPKFICNDPFKEDGVLVMCDTYKDEYNRWGNNFRFVVKSLLDEKDDSEPFCKFDQEFYIVDPTTNRPIGFPSSGCPQPEDIYYCGVGFEGNFGRNFIDDFLRKSIDVGLMITGINQSETPGQWVMEVGPIDLIQSADQLWILRYILQKLGEEYSYIISFDPKIVPGYWHCSGLVPHFSTVKTRGDNKKETLDKFVKKLEESHDMMLQFYGSGNEYRIDNLEEFTCGDSESNSVTVSDTFISDHRPSSNADPYLVAAMLFQTCCLDDEEENTTPVEDDSSPVEDDTEEEPVYKDEDGSILVDKEDKSQSRDVIYTDDGETVLLKHNIDEKE